MSMYTDEFYMLLYDYAIGVAPIQYNRSNIRQFITVAYHGQILFLADNSIVICDFSEFFDESEIYTIYIKNGFIKSYEVE